MSTDLIKKLKDFHGELKQLRFDVKKEKTKQISKKKIQSSAEHLGTAWFAEFKDFLTDDASLATDIIERYSLGFQRLIKLSSPNNLRRSYQEILNVLCRSFRNDLILPLQQRPTGSLKGVNELTKMLQTLPDPAQNEYLKEACDCAKREYFRAAVVLGWCAAIDQIHRTIEKNGFTSFNVTSAKMASEKIGRFKKFNQVQNVNSIGELREVFDAIILWILEGMQLIDSNEHTRLHSCFELRCQCAHPGNAPITEYNLLSFFSDLNKIVFRNAKFKV